MDPRFLEAVQRGGATEVLSRPRSRAFWVLLLAMLLAQGVARADKIDQLTRSALRDSSWRVRLQAVAVLGKLHDPRALAALERALSDSKDSIRALAARGLGRLGDARAIAALQRVRRDRSSLVRGEVNAALALLHPASAVLGGPPAGLVHVEIGGVGNKVARAAPELTSRLREFVTRELQRMPGVTLEGRPVSGYSIDSAITELSRRNTDKWVEVSCEVSLIVGKLPSRSMVMMTSGGATVQAPRAGFRPERERLLQVDALQSAVQGAHQNLLVFLKARR